MPPGCCIGSFPFPVPKLCVQSRRKKDPIYPPRPSSTSACSNTRGSPLRSGWVAAKAIDSCLVFVLISLGPSLPVLRTPSHLSDPTYCPVLAPLKTAIDSPVWAFSCVPCISRYQSCGPLPVNEALPLEQTEKIPDLWAGACTPPKKPSTPPFGFFLAFPACLVPCLELSTDA